MWRLKNRMKKNLYCLLLEHNHAVLLNKMCKLWNMPCFLFLCVLYGVFDTWSDWVKSWKVRWDVSMGEIEQLNEQVCSVYWFIKIWRKIRSRQIHIYDLIIPYPGYTCCLRPYQVLIHTPDDTAVVDSPVRSTQEPRSHHNHAYYYVNFSA